MSRTRRRDLRWLASAALVLVGVAGAVLLKSLNGDDWREFGVVAGYSITWALCTFALLYPVAKAFEGWEWDRDDHDLTAAFEEAKE